MDQKLSINQEKENTLFFNVDIQGVEQDNIKVRFSICLPNMDLSFHCEHKKGDQWKVTIPKLPFTDTGDYKCLIEVIANEYYFTAMEGELKIITTPKVKASKVSTDETKIDKDEPPSVSASFVSVETEGVTQPFEQITEHESLDDQTSIDIDEKVSNVLKELGLGQRQTKARSLKSYLQK